MQTARLRVEAVIEVLGQVFRPPLGEAGHPVGQLGDARPRVVVRRAQHLEDLVQLADLLHTLTNELETGMRRAGAMHLEDRVQLADCLHAHVIT